MVFYEQCEKPEIQYFGCLIFQLNFWKWMVNTGWKNLQFYFSWIVIDNQLSSIRGFLAILINVYNYCNNYCEWLKKWENEDIIGVIKCAKFQPDLFNSLWKKLIIYPKDELFNQLLSRKWSLNSFQQCNEFLKASTSWIYFKVVINGV